MEAASHGDDAAVRALLEHSSSNVDAADRWGWTACHWACMRSHAGVLKQLLEAGADPRLQDGEGRTAGDHVVKFLLRLHDCDRTLQEWDRAYTLWSVRCVRDGQSGPRSETPQKGS